MDFAPSHGIEIVIERPRWMACVLAIVVCFAPAVTAQAKAAGAPPTAEAPVAEDFTAEDFTAEDSTAEDSTAEDSTAEDSTAEDSTAEDPPTGFPPLGSGVGEAEEMPEEKPPKSPFGPPPGAKRLSKDEPIWIDLKRKALFIDGRVAMREGPPLEMFACPAHSKEHESVVAVYAKPSTVHPGLLILGAKIGHPVQFDPYVPAAGTKVDIIVMWKDEEGRDHKMAAQQWVRSISSQKALAHPWVFAGSGIWTDEKTGETGYKADSGDFICVSNFDTAMLDLPIPSSTAKTNLLYEAFTENIPPKGTPVRLVLLPRLHEMPDVPDKATPPKGTVP